MTETLPVIVFLTSLIVNKCQQFLVDDKYIATAIAELEETVANTVSSQVFIFL